MCRLAECKNTKCKNLFIVRWSGGTVCCPMCRSDCRLSDVPNNGYWTTKQPIVQEPIKDVYPLSEFHSRLEGTTAFVMTEETNWNTYVRSNNSRYGKQQSFTPGFVKKPKNFMGFSAKTGTYKNVLSRPEVREKLLHEGGGDAPPFFVQSGFIYDALLCYRIAACRYIGEKLEWDSCRYKVVANSDNDYPCLIVEAPGGPTDKEIRQKGKRETNKKHWCRFVMASFVGMVNRNAWSQGIPIELTMRSSFGFLAPSVAEVGASFRINVGIVPVQYMDVLAASIIELYEEFSEKFKKRLKGAKPSDKFTTLVRKYNKRKLEVFEKRQKQYEDYVEEEKRALKKRERSSSGDANMRPTKKLAKPRKPVPLEANIGGTSWDMLWSGGDSSGKTVLTQVADRSQVNLEGFSDRAQESNEKLLEGTVKLADRFVLKNDSIGLAPPKLRPLERFETYSPKGQQLIVDQEFWSMIQLLVAALDAPYEEFMQFYDPRERWGHVGGLYAFLDGLNVRFIRAYASRFVGHGASEASDSEEEDELEVGGQRKFGVRGKERRFGGLEDEKVKWFPSKKIRVYSKKHITATGMRAIHLAHHCCRVYASERGVKLTEIKVASKRMYYETAEAVEKVPIQKDVAFNSQLQKMSSASVLFFDLNHCNALQDKNPLIAFERFDLIVLDHTSATTSRVHFYLKEAFRHEKVRLVLLVTSGLKNEQSGSDLNTYGTLRIVARSAEERDRLLKAVQEVDLESDQPYWHPKASHAIRRAHKHRGFVPRTSDFLGPGFPPSLRTQEPTLFHYDVPGGGSTITFEVCDVPADGNCLFTALSGMTPSLLSPKRVRTKICALLREHLNLVPTGMDLQVGLGFSTTRVNSKDEYISVMGQDLVWGGMTEIQVFSYERPVVVFETAREPVYFKDGTERRTGLDWQALPEDTVYLAFYGNHYAGLVRR